MILRCLNEFSPPFWFYAATSAVIAAIVGVATKPLFFDTNLIINPTFVAQRHQNTSASNRFRVKPFQYCVTRWASCLINKLLWHGLDHAVQFFKRQTRRNHFLIYWYIRLYILCLFFELRARKNGHLTKNTVENTFRVKYINLKFNAIPL